MNCVEFGFGRSRGFESSRGQFWPIAVDRPTRPHNIASTTVQQVITCKRVCAKHNVKDEKCDFQASAQPKSLNGSTWNFVRLLTSVRLRDLPKMIGIGWLEAAPQIGEYNLRNLSYTILYLTVFCFTFFIFVYLFSPNVLNDSHLWQLNQRSSP
jgi:hypothetical protein